MHRKWRPARGGRRKLQGPARASFLPGAWQTIGTKCTTLKSVCTAVENTGAAAASLAPKFEKTSMYLQQKQEGRIVL
jgi:hypothetical protein